MNEPIRDDALQAALRRLEASNLKQMDLLRRGIRLAGEGEAMARLAREQGEEIEASHRLLLTVKRFMRVAEAAGTVQWELDVPSGRVLLGTSWDEMVGEPESGRNWDRQRVMARVHPEDVPLVEQSVRDVLDGSAPRMQVEYRIAAATGWIWVESLGLVTERDAADAPLRLTGRNVDITQRRRMHDDMEQARAQAEASSHAKSEFLANVSHEVRTPLNAVMGLTRLLQQSALDSEQRKYLELIDRSATSLLALLNDVLDLSKIEAGKLVFEQIRFDVGRWVREAVALHTPAAQAKGLKVMVDIASDVPERVEGDPGRLRQVISNLVSNAVKFTEQGRIFVTVRMAPNQADLRHDQMRILFAVRDSGVGIPVDKQQQILDAFTQADASTTRRHGGTGLGLAICVRLVSMMDGALHVLSRPGEGSTFRFTAVFEQSAAERAPTTEPVPLEDFGGAGLHVLLAEDHAVNELLMRKLLEQMGCVVTVARDGEEAVHRWERQPASGEGRFGLVLMDVQMPVLSGFDATAQIRALEVTRPGQPRTPIVAITAHAMAGDREKCLAAGMDAYVSKPVSPALLVQAIREAMARSTGVPAAAPVARKVRARPQPDTAILPLAAALPVEVKSTANTVIDLEQLVRNMGGDRDAVAEVALAMRSDMAERRQLLRDAIAEGTERLVHDEVHALKGALSAIGAHRAAAATKVLELAARAGDWNAAAWALALLEQDIEQVDAALAKFISDTRR